MSKGMYLGSEGLAKKGTDIYVGVDGVARKVSKGYVGVGGVCRQFWPSITYYVWNVYNINYTEEITRESNITFNMPISPAKVCTWIDKEIVNGVYDLTNARLIQHGLSSNSGFHSTDGGFIVGRYNNSSGYSSSTGWYWDGDYTLSANSSGTWQYTLYCDKYQIKSNMGSYVKQVVSTNKSTYPTNGIQGSYWYVYQGTR